MTQPFANLPKPIQDAIAAILQDKNASSINTKAHDLHDKYTAQDKGNHKSYFQNPESNFYDYLYLVQYIYREDHEP